MISPIVSRISHFHAKEVSLPDAPRADEIVAILAVKVADVMSKKESG